MNPSFVVRFHGGENLLDLRFLEPTMVIVVVEESRGGSDEDELGEEIWATDRGEDSDHGGDGVADVGAAADLEGIEDIEEVVDIGVEGSVAIEVKVVWVDRAGADEVVEDDSICLGEEREDQMPRRLVRTEAVGEDEDSLARPDHPHVQGFEYVLTHPV
ncbi:PREDICTED: uncharacterized protein LOC104804883 [Tarenaya hassleriana]|uniref:uncharacterized protein LOC104804883 n=1 Tax=Tarenaya hassleriana TaxID=28532 RepID=UPI00053C35E7|nr:PREDICTED: uncharacterized protein LOC104804883 [Tarenaya hassleriana]